MTCNIPPIPPKMRKCLGCDLEFPLTAGKQMKRYHNDACRDKANAAKLAAAAPAKADAPLLQCALPECSNSFEAKTHTQKYCCTGHQKAHKRQVEDARQAAEANKLRICSNSKCLRPFKRIPSPGAMLEHCCAACRDAGKDASVSLLNRLSCLNRKGARKGSAE